MKGAPEGLQGLEKGFEGGFKVKSFKAAWWGLQKGFKGASERFEGGLSKVRKVFEKGF